MHCVYVMRPNNTHSNQTMWAMSLPVGCYHPHTPSPYIAKGKGFPYSVPSVGVGPGADPGVWAVSLQVSISHPSGGRPSLL